MNKEKREEFINSFDPDNSLLANAGVFGLPFDVESAEIILYPVPWEVTVSFREGTAQGPAAIYQASAQVDLYDHHFGEVWKKGIHLYTEHFSELINLSNKVRTLAKEQIQTLEQGGEPNQDLLKSVNEACFHVKDTVKAVAKQLGSNGHTVALIGGDHSTPLGLIEALADEHEGDFAILQIDAHADLRVAYEGFTFSHASIMHNVLEYNSKIKLVQLGVRDYSAAEKARIDSDERIHCFFDQDIKDRMFEGENWATIAKEVVDALPQKIYISFDVDGMQPSLCPGTGTPVPGGFSFEQMAYLFKLIKESGKQVLSFDVNETAPQEWDAIVASRIIYKLCALL